MEPAIKYTTLCFVFDWRNEKVLMIEKKRGQGAGKWNFPGGKVKAGETIERAAIRETEEETGIIPSSLQKMGTLEFHFPEGNSWSNVCTVFKTDAFTGKLGAENEECVPAWVDIDNIPFEKMWSTDSKWVPALLEGKQFYRVYRFGKDDNHTEEKILDNNV